MNKVEQINKLFEDHSFVEYIGHMRDPEEIREALAQKGVELTAEELNEILMSVGETVAPLFPEGELGEDDLDNVSGGAVEIAIVLGAGAKIFCAVAGGLLGVAAVAGLAYCGYKIYKKYN